jgi:hypothetical protein
MTKSNVILDPTTNAVLAILNRHDPEGLLDLGAPADEYEAEARDLAGYVRTGRPVTADVLTRVWEEWFTSEAHLLAAVSAPVRAAIVADLADLTD